MPICNKGDVTSSQLTSCTSALKSSIGYGVSMSKVNEDFIFSNDFDS